MSQNLGDNDNALYLDCGNVPAPGHGVFIDPSGKLVTGPLPGRAIPTNAILGSHLAGIDQLVFGVPTDGIFVADGAATMPGANRAGSTYTLTRDVNFTQLTVNATVTIATSGFRLYAQTLQLNGSAVIHNDGVAGSAGAAASAGTGGAAGAGATAQAQAGSISFTVGQGSAGGAGGNTGAGGGNAQRAIRIAPAAGNDGGAGGNGAPGTTSAGNAGTKGDIVRTTVSIYSYPKIVDLWDTNYGRGIAGGSGGSGGGGGGGGTTGGGGGGGGGGTGGGVCLVVAGTFDAATGAWTGRISANGGDGGAGGSPVGNGGIGGAGGPGGGGVTILLARLIVGSISMTTAAGATATAALQARTGAVGTGNTTNSSTGGPGTAFVLSLHQPWQPATQFGRPAILDARPLFRVRQPLRPPNPPLSVAGEFGRIPIFDARPPRARVTSSGSRDVLKP